MNLKDPESMNAVIGNLLRYGVIVSAVVILAGIVRLSMVSGYTDASGALTYLPNSVPHWSLDASPIGLLSGVFSLDPFSLIEIGALILIATPVSRVLISVVLFEAEGDRQYVLITAVVLALLLFSMLVTPFIPGFRA